MRQVLGARVPAETGRPGQLGSPQDSKGLCPQGLTWLPKGLWSHRQVPLLAAPPSAPGLRCHCLLEAHPDCTVSTLSSPSELPVFLSFLPRAEVYVFMSELPQQSPHLIPPPGLSFVSLPSSTSSAKLSRASPVPGESHRSNSPPRGSHRHWCLWLVQGHVPADPLACLLVSRGQGHLGLLLRAMGPGTIRRDSGCLGTDNCLSSTYGQEAGGAGGPWLW